MSISLPLAPVIIICGLFMLFKLRFFTLLSPLRVLRKCRTALSTGTARSNLALALAGTLGVGNIVGIAVGLSVGGSGTLLWVLISSVFSSVLKYSEATLSTYYGNKGYGFMAVLEHSFVGCGQAMGTVYALCCLVLSFFLGGALQSSAVSGVMPIDTEYSFVVWGIFAILVSLVVFRGGSFIKGFTSFVIPAACGMYVLLCLFVIVKNANELPSVLSDIVCSAFTPAGAIGGAAGALSSRAVSEGFSRGLLSNEAGAGTSSLATSDGISEPTDAGILGLLEVVFDTVLLCTLTGVSILVCVPDPTSFNSGALLVRESIGASLGGFSGVLVPLLIFAFAFSTVVCWYYYGIRCLDYLSFGSRGVYTVLFLISVALLPLVGESLLVLVSDVLLLVLTLFTVVCIIKSSDRIRKLSELSGLLPFIRH